LILQIVGYGVAGLGGHFERRISCFANRRTGRDGRVPGRVRFAGWAVGGGRTVIRRRRPAAIIRRDGRICRRTLLAREIARQSVRQFDDTVRSVCVHAPIRARI